MDRKMMRVRIIVIPVILNARPLKLKLLFENAENIE